MPTRETRIVDRLLTRSGITAPAQAWQDLGFAIHTDLPEPQRGCSPADIDLLTSRQESGHDDWRALAWLHKWRLEHQAESAKNAAAIQLAQALAKAGDDWVHGARVMRQQAAIASR